MPRPHRQSHVSSRPLHRQELNGRRGTIVTFVRDTQRFGVKLDGDGVTKAVKSAHLKRLEEYPNPNLTEAWSPLTRRQTHDPGDVCDDLLVAGGASGTPEQRLGESAGGGPHVTSD